MRTFEYNDAKSHKFWNIELQGKSFTVTFGKVGSQGQTQAKEFADEARARKEHDKLVREKLAKGYVETTPPPGAAVAPAPGGGPLREALEAALVDNPDDLAAHMAYADYLAEQGDPRGELIQVQLGLEDPARTRSERRKFRQRESKLLQTHQREWLGALAPYLLDEDSEEVEFSGPPHYQFHIARGWLDSLRLRELSVPLARILAGHPLARLLRELTIIRLDRGTWGYDEPGFVDLARSAILGNVRRFQLGPDNDQCHTSGAGVVPVIARMTRLEELYLYAHQVEVRDLFALPLSRLRVLTVNHLDDYPLEVLAANPSLGRLESLSCWPHALEPRDMEAYITAAGVTALVHSPHLKNLTHLALYLTDLGDEGVAAIIESGILRRLKVLDLWNGRISDAGAHALAACPDLHHLERLRLTGNQLTQAGIAALRATGVPVEAERQFTAADVAENEHLNEGDVE